MPLKDKKYWLQKKEILRQLKFSMEKNKDKFQALVFKASEMDAYRHSLQLTRHTWSDLFLLFLNRISNQHGLKWIRAIGFMIVCCLIFYSLFLMAANGFSFFRADEYIFLPFTKDFWNGVVNFLWLPEGINDLSIFIKGEHTGLMLSIGILSYILGKILIAYGIFQIISAFRKYVKN